MVILPSPPRSSPRARLDADSTPSPPPPLTPRSELRKLDDEYIDSRLSKSKWYTAEMAAAVKAMVVQLPGKRATYASLMEMPYFKNCPTPVLVSKKAEMGAIDRDINLLFTPLLPRSFLAPSLPHSLAHSLTALSLPFTLSRLRTCTNAITRCHMSRRRVSRTSRARTISRMLSGTKRWSRRTLLSFHDGLFGKGTASHLSLRHSHPFRTSSPYHRMPLFRPCRPPESEQHKFKDFVSFEKGEMLESSHERNATLPSPPRSSLRATSAQCTPSTHATRRIRDSTDLQPGAR